MSQKFVVIASPPFQYYNMPVQPKAKVKKKEIGDSIAVYARASKRSLCCMLSPHAQGTKMPSVKKVRLISSSNNQVALTRLLEKVIHVPGHFQPALLAVWAIAHADASFVAARI